MQPAALRLHRNRVFISLHDRRIANTVSRSPTRRCVLWAGDLCVMGRRPLGLRSEALTRDQLRSSDGTKLAQHCGHSIEEEMVSYCWRGPHVCGWLQESFAARTVQNFNCKKIKVPAIMASAFDSFFYGKTAMQFYLWNVPSVKLHRWCNLIQSFWSCHLDLSETYFLNWRRHSEPINLVS